jgi:hypothetical protein
MDRDIKIGVIVWFILISVIMIWTSNSEYNSCLQAGAEARSYESFATANNPDAIMIWEVCSINS